jgi:hypothetical protein
MRHLHGGATVLALGSFIFLMVRRDRNTAIRALRPSPSPFRMSPRS